MQSAHSAVSAEPSKLRVVSYPKKYLLTSRTLPPFGVIIVIIRAKEFSLYIQIP